MNLFKSVSKGTLVVVMLVMSAYSFANEAGFDSQKFIDIASLRCISEIETAKVALQNSSSPEVKAYAQSMISDYATTLSSLRKLAETAHLKMLSDEELQSKAHSYVFERNGSSFDTAYATMRCAERRKTVNLYREAIASNDAFEKAYAEAALPLLMRHLYMAQKLVETVGSNKASMVASNS